MQLVVPSDSQVLGNGLLPRDFCQDLRAELEDGLADAYSSIRRTKAGNARLWQGLREDEFKRLRQSYDALGLESSPVAWDALWAGVDLPVPGNDGVAHSRLVVALATNYGPRICQHIRYRHAHNGNVHFRFTGPTGSGKSSCAISLLDWTSPIEPANLVNHLAYDLAEVPRKLPHLKPHQGLLLDEVLTTSGEGSRTAQVMLDNLEDTLRASERDLYVSSPSDGQHSTMQVTFVAIAWHPKLRFTVFLCWVNGIPMGVMAIPWCSQEHYARYAPWKKEKVERSLRGQFNDNEATAKAVMHLFENPRFTEYLWLGVNKPKVGDFNNGFVLFYEGMLSQAQLERGARMAYEMCYGYERVKDKFQWFYGVTPNPNFLRIAAKCYEE